MHLNYLSLSALAYALYKEKSCTAWIETHLFDDLLVEVQEYKLDVLVLSDQRVENGKA